MGIINFLNDIQLPVSIRYLLKALTPKILKKNGNFSKPIYLFFKRVFEKIIATRAMEATGTK